MAGPCFQGEGQPNIVFKTIRFILFLFVTMEMWLLHHNLAKSSDFIRICIYFTTWGLIFTFISIWLGTYITFAKTSTKNKYSPFCAWKWYIFTYELAFIMEIIITCVFWLLLYSSMKKKPLYANSEIQMLGLVLHHSLPLILLVIDYTINAMPIVGRHIYMICFMCAAYLMLNYYVTIKRGTPVYGIMSWDSPKALMIPVGTVLAGLIIFSILTIIN